MIGYAEGYCVSHAIGGTYIMGWIDFTWTHSVDLDEICVLADGKMYKYVGYISIYDRDDLRKSGFGFVLFIDSLTVKISHPAVIHIMAEDLVYKIAVDGNIKALSIQLAKDIIRFSLATTKLGKIHSKLSNVLSRPAYCGSETFDSLAWPVEIRFDLSIFCPPMGLFLKGWLIDPFLQVSKVLIISSYSTFALNTSNWISFPRDDVVSAFKNKFNLQTNMCGFIYYIDNFAPDDNEIYLQVELKDGSVAYSPFSFTRNLGVDLIKSVLGSISLRSYQLDSAFDHVLGPAIERINSFRLSQKPKIDILQFGRCLENYHSSLIVPLYGRVDFLEYQLALFADVLDESVEIIYVLDEPGRREEVEHLCRTCCIKFVISFKVILLDRNVGFAPANNIGVHYSKGEFICLLNSDVFPENSDWLKSLIEILISDDKVGIVGAKMQYEDGTIQHAGCKLESLADYGGWMFPSHPGKGLRVDELTGKRNVIILTGACMVMRREVFVDIGGFDEGYIIGDFEDVDLCLRVISRNLTCVVAMGVKIYHLERQSQAIDPGFWRHNITLYNAWRFQRRWIKDGSIRLVTDNGNLHEDSI